MADWHTLPDWKTAHSLEQYGSLGATRLWVTVCGREYCTPDHEVDDEPLPAPDEMPRCKLCVRAYEERANPDTEGQTETSVDSRVELIKRGGRLPWGI
jgi:hypothetical protein